LGNKLLWGTNFAHDINFLAEKAFLANKKVILAVGNNDEFITEKAIKKVKKFAEEHEIKYELIEFDGKHEIPRDVLQQVASNL